MLWEGSGWTLHPETENLRPELMGQTQGAPGYVTLLTLWVKCISSRANSCQKRIFIAEASADWGVLYVVSWFLCFVFWFVLILHMAC